MEPNDQLCSANGDYQLRMQADGNLVTYLKVNGSYSKPIWSVGNWSTSDRPIETCLNFDGNLMIYNAMNYKVWTTRSWSLNSTDPFTILENNGTLAIYDGDQKLWGSDVAPRSVINCASRIEAGTCIGPGDIFCSPNGTFYLIFQASSGNLEIYRNPAKEFKDVIWQTSTGYEGAERACMNLDGNFVIYDDLNLTLWESYTSIQGGEIYAMVEDFGNLAIFQGSQRRWSSGWSSFEFKLLFTTFCFRSTNSQF